MNSCGIIIGIAAMILVVYLDLAFWDTFGPGSEFQQFPVIYLIIFPVMLILASVFWGRMPRSG